MIKNKLIQLDDVVVQQPGHIVSDMDGETVMLSVEIGKYYNLGDIGGSIWSEIQSPIPVRQLIANLMTKYAVDQEECEEHVLAFLEQLLEEGLVTKQ
ncbi:lasso peptide biosynthesis PqqD family chaperone [Paenibacillus mendelii]|uniref:Lasso peptide biosynthesis PqqD family chaperone n=1 Tax=Paenibacillus mendelii TaxID=206163 RepID=A0ABV6JJH0_9BACL|nr:lasso peptide biosynthesis PqqD family chaperone [Paenibacillus mendelii]MCQ6558995.1 lasso peptide biosynthesis PqqD family chaperone [Paenibacillus mendelii]